MYLPCPQAQDISAFQGKRSSKPEKQLIFWRLFQRERLENVSEKPREQSNIFGVRAQQENVRLSSAVITRNVICFKKSC